MHHFLTFLRPLRGTMHHFLRGGGRYIQPSRTEIPTTRGGGERDAPPPFVDARKLLWMVVYTPQNVRSAHCRSMVSLTGGVSLTDSHPSRRRCAKSADHRDACLPIGGDGGYTSTYEPRRRCRLFYKILILPPQHAPQAAKKFCRFMRQD